eukprot:832711_1
MMSSNLKQRFLYFKRQTHAKFIRGNDYQLSVGVKGVVTWISSKGNNQLFEICMNQLFTSLLILHTHTFMVNEYGSPLIYINDDLEQFKYLEDCPHNVRLMISDICFGHSDVICGDSTEILLCHMWRINDRKTHEIRGITSVWYEESNCDAMWDINITEMIVFYCGLLQVDEKRLRSLLFKYIAAKDGAKTAKVVGCNLE